MSFVIINITEHIIIVLYIAATCSPILRRHPATRFVAGIALQKRLRRPPRDRMFDVVHHSCALMQRFVRICWGAVVLPGIGPVMRKYDANLWQPMRAVRSPIGQDVDVNNCVRTAESVRSLAGQD